MFRNFPNINVDTRNVPVKYENICGTKFSRYLFSARSVWYSYCVIQLGVLVTQNALIAPIYKQLSVSCSSFGSANATRYSTVLLFFYAVDFIFMLFCVSPFNFSVEILVI